MFSCENLACFIDSWIYFCSDVNLSAARSALPPQGGPAAARAGAVPRRWAHRPEGDRTLQPNRPENSPSGGSVTDTNQTSED